MAVDNPRRIIELVRNTTVAPPGLVTLDTSRRYIGTPSFAMGYGLVDAHRLVSHDETTIIDPGLVGGAVVGLTTFGLYLAGVGRDSAVSRRNPALGR